METEFGCDLNMADCVCDFSGGNLRCTLGDGGNGRDQGFAFNRDTCGVVVTHATFLCILLACFEGLTHCMSSGLSVLVHL